MSTATAGFRRNAEDIDNLDHVTGEIIETGGPIAISAGVRAEIDVQIATAKRFPRNVKAARDMAKSMAISSEEVAASCCYTLKRGGKAIKGPSIRLAEIMVQAWGNIRAETRINGADHMTVEAESVCWDLERNVAIRAAVKRRITGRDGRRYNDDMIVTTGNAAASVAFRNAVFRTIPKTFVHEVYDDCEAIAVGDIKTLAERRTKALEYFARFGVNSEQVCKRMGRGSVDELTLDDVAQLKAMAEQVKRGDLTIEDAFAEEAEAPAGKSATGIADELGKQMDDAINKGKPAEGKPAAEDRPATAEEEARRAKFNKSKAAGAAAAAAPAEKPALPTCKPGAAGCGGDFGPIKIGSKTYQVCAEHEPAFRKAT